MMRLIKKVALLWVLVVTVCLSCVSCGGTDSSSGTPTRQEVASTEPRQDLVDFLRSTMSFDYEAAASPQDLLRQVEVGVSGEVVAVDSVLIKDDVESTGGVIVTLVVKESWKTPGRSGVDRVQMILQRPTNVSLDLFVKALPVGTRIALFGYSTSLQILNRPGASTLVFEPAPQGLMIEAPDGSLVNVWGDEYTGSPNWADVESLGGLRRALGA